MIKMSRINFILKVNLTDSNRKYLNPSTTCVGEGGGRYSLSQILYSAGGGYYVKKDR